MASLLLRLLTHPFTQALQVPMLQLTVPWLVQQYDATSVQAGLILCVGVLGWTLSALRRRRERLRLQDAGYNAFLQQRARMVKAPNNPFEPAQAADAAATGCAVLQQRADMAASVAGSAPASTSTSHSCSRSIFKSRTAHSSCNSSNSSNGNTSALWPPLAVVLPVKGCRPHSTHNWASQLAAQYDGATVFVFAVESADDPAVAAVEGLLQQQGAVSLQLPQQQQGCGCCLRAVAAACLQQQERGKACTHDGKEQHTQAPSAHVQQGGEQQQQRFPGVLSAWCRPQQQLGVPGRLVLVAAAGQCSRCSQKIHNILHGIEVASPLMQLWQEQQQQPHVHIDSVRLREQQQLLTAKQQVALHKAKQGAGCVHIHAVAGGSSTDGGSSGDDSSCNGSIDGSSTGNTDPSCGRGINEQVGAGAGGFSPPGVPDTATPAAATSNTAAGTAEAAAGVAATAGHAACGGYVCVLDDDVMLHPLSLMQLVDEMEAHPDLFMATGYPFDIVADSNSSTSSSSSVSSLWGRLLSYAAASYHLPLTIGFSIADRGSFVWGGTMLLRAAALADHPPLHLWQQRQPEQQEQQEQPSQQQRRRRQQQHRTQHKGQKHDQGQAAWAPPSILQVWRDGGYSDDLLLAAYCQEHGLAIGLPAAALYPQLLPGGITLQQYWNYLHRQLFVLDTYYSSSNRTTNHTLMLLHSYASAAFTAAVAAALLQLLAVAATAAVAVAGGGCCWLLQLLGCWPVGGAEVGQLLQQWAGCRSSGEVVGGTASAAAAEWVTPGLCVLLVCVCLAQGAMWLLTRECLALMHLLSPQAAAATAEEATAAAGDDEAMAAAEGRNVVAPEAAADGPDAAVRAGTASGPAANYLMSMGATPAPSGVKQPQQQPPLLLHPRVSFVLLWAGWVFENALLPACMAVSYLHDWICWGGIWYRKAGGRVAQVLHPVAAGH